MALGNLIGLPRFMLDHRWTMAHLSDELDGQLDPAEHGRLTRHVAKCGRCRELLSSLRKTVDALRSVTPRPEPGLADRTIERLDRSSTRAPDPRAEGAP